jgi:hypothetical protein
MFMSYSSSYSRNYHGHMRELKRAGEAGPRDSPPLGTLEERGKKNKEV